MSRTLVLRTNYDVRSSILVLGNGKPHTSIRDCVWIELTFLAHCFLADRGAFLDVPATVTVTVATGIGAFAAQSSFPPVVADRVVNLFLDAHCSGMVMVLIPSDLVSCGLGQSKYCSGQ